MIFDTPDRRSPPRGRFDEPGSEFDSVPEADVGGDELGCDDDGSGFVPELDVEFYLDLEFGRAFDPAMEIAS